MHPTLSQLLQLCKQHELRVSLRKDTQPLYGLLPVKFYIKKQYWDLFIDDEYGDFDEAKQPLCIFLSLLSLETYQELPDFLMWCNSHGIPPNNEQARQYHISLRHTYPSIELQLGKVDSIIPSLDYQLRTGVIDELMAC